MPNWSDLYTLDREQQEMLMERWDLYAPGGWIITNKRGQMGIPDGSPDYTNVPVFHTSTQDMEYLGLMGRQTASNFVTQDLLMVHALQPITTSWKAVQRTTWPDGTRHAQYGMVFEVEGEGKTDSTPPRSRTETKMVFIKPSVPVPAGKQG